jgi:hypothetical protein
VSFEDMTACLRELAELPRQSALLAAPLVEEALKRTAAAGTDPLGNPWIPKKDGTPPLTNAADAISAAAVGTTVRATLTGPTVFHHFGGGRNPRRPVLPDPGTIPPDVAAALHAAASKAFEKAVA